MESAKYASSAVTRLRRSVFIDATYAFCLVLANLGIAIAARMPMITTTINSSINVKPLRFDIPLPLPLCCMLRALLKARRGTVALGVPLHARSYFRTFVAWAPRIDAPVPQSVAQFAR